MNVVIEDGTRANLSEREDGGGRCKVFLLTPPVRELPWYQQPVTTSLQQEESWSPKQGNGWGVGGKGGGRDTCVC